MESTDMSNRLFNLFLIVLLFIVVGIVGWGYYRDPAFRPQLTHTPTAQEKLQLQFDELCQDYAALARLGAKGRTLGMGRADVLAGDQRGAVSILHGYDGTLSPDDAYQHELVACQDRQHREVYDAGAH